MIFFISVFLLFPAFLLSGTWFGKETTTLALFKDPVVNLYAGNFFEENPPISYGENNSLANGKQYKRRCPSHQGLFNEVVTVLSRKGSQIEVACDNLIYGFDPITEKPLCSFWVDESHLIFLTELSDQALLSLPSPGDLKEEEVILVLPWNEYSAGTRFILSKELDESYLVNVLDKNTYQLIYLAIPKNLALIKKEDLSFLEQKKLFVKLAHDLIVFARKIGVIPYVLGGSSYVVSYEEDLFYEQLGYYERVGPNNPYMGYDCSEFVFRLAQMSGIPYLPKTTIVARKILRPVKGELTEGDLIWFSGHMMIISSLEKNEIIEARGYQSGYGKVHILPLSKCFEGIVTFEQLKNAHQEKKPIKLLNKEGVVSSVIKEFDFLSLI